MSRGHRSKHIEVITDYGVVDLCELDEVLKPFMVELDSDVQDNGGNQLIYVSSSNMENKQ